MGANRTAGRGTTQREQAYGHIRRKLAEGALATGARLSPIALAQEIGMSHTPVREAISQLQSEGFVVYTAHYGAFVRELSRRELVDVIEVRAALECRAAARAARRMSPARTRELTARWKGLVRAVKAFKAAPEREMDRRGAAWARADIMFHMVLLSAAGNMLAMRIIEDYRIMSTMFGWRAGSPEAPMDQYDDSDRNLQTHQAVYEAVLKRDPKAARSAMAAHMRHTRHNILARFDQLEPRREEEDPE